MASMFDDMSFAEINIMQLALKKVGWPGIEATMTTEELANKERIRLKTLDAAVDAAATAYGKDGDGEAFWEKKDRMVEVIRKTLATPLGGRKRTAKKTAGKRTVKKTKSRK